MLANLLVRVTDPGDIGLNVQCRIEMGANRVRHDNTALACNQFGTQIVRVTTKAARKSALSEAATVT